jgi:hypothetical protein
LQGARGYLGRARSGSAPPELHTVPLGAPAFSTGTGYAQGARLGALDSAAAPSGALRTARAAISPGPSPPAGFVESIIYSRAPCSLT